MIFSSISSFGSTLAYPIPQISKKPYSYQSRKVFSKSNQVLDLKSSKTLENRKTCECFDLYKELVPYDKAWSWQKNIVKEKKALIQRNEECGDTLIILQHTPVYTMGTASSEEYLNFDIKDPPFQVFRTERGGEVTFHGPGQLVMYPIINLRNHKMDLHWYLRTLEEVVIRVLFSTFCIKASRLEGLTGVWVGDQKLAAIGIRVSQWITYHGLALNVTTDLTPFRWIVPCGIQNRQVGSIKELVGRTQPLNGCRTSEIVPCSIQNRQVGSIKELVGRTQPLIGCRTSDLQHPDDCQLIDITRNSLIKEFSEVFQLEVQHKTIPLLEFSEKVI